MKPVMNLKTDTGTERGLKQQYPDLFIRQEPVDQDIEGWRISHLRR